MTFPTNPTERSPKGDHNRRLALGIDRDVFAAEAGVTVEELRDYEETGPDGRFDVSVAERVGRGLELMETLREPRVANGPVPAETAPAREFEDETVEAAREEEDLTDNPNPSPMNPAFP